MQGTQLHNDESTVLKMLSAELNVKLLKKWDIYDTRQKGGEWTSRRRKLYEFVGILVLSYSGLNHPLFTAVTMTEVWLVMTRWETRTTSRLWPIYTRIFYQLSLQAVKQREQHFSTASSPTAMHTDAAYTDTQIARQRQRGALSEGWMWIWQRSWRGGGKGGKKGEKKITASKSQHKENVTKEKKQFKKTASMQEESNTSD
jgi:hypothetical protein